jgi:hypothetical protein
MDQGFCRGFTTAEKTELWDRWQRGESLKAIGRAFGKQSSSIYFQISPHGGIRPAPRRRSRLTDAAMGFLAPAMYWYGWAAGRPWSTSVWCCRCGNAEAPDQVAKLVRMDLVGACAVNGRMRLPHAALV